MLPQKPILLLAIAILMLSYFPAHGKDKGIIYYDEDWYMTKNKKEAFYYYVVDSVELDKDIGYFKYYYIGGELLWEGHKSECNPLNIKKDVYEDTCIWYYKNGNKKSEGVYEDGILNGYYTNFYENGKMKSTCAYEKDKKNGVLYFFNEDGNITRKTPYLDGKINGNDSFWYANGALNHIIYFPSDNQESMSTYWYKSGKLKSVEKQKNDFATSFISYYENDSVKSFIKYGRKGAMLEVRTFWPNSKPKRIDIYEDDSLASGTCFDSLGNTIPYFEYQIMPAFPNGEAAIMKFISKNVRYPSSALEHELKGKVLVYFVVDKSGKVTDARIEKSVSASLDREALRVINMMPDWTPGMQDGEFVDVSYRIPINYTLH